MSLDAIIKGAVQVQKTIPGIREAFENAPESLNNLPCFVTYLDSFTVERAGANLKTIIYTLKMPLLVSRSADLAGSDATLKPFLRQVVDVFDQNITLFGNAWYTEVKSGKYGVIEYAGTPFLGIDFTLEAQERYTVVYQG